MTTDEVLRLCIVDIESTVNNGPLAPLSSDAKDQPPLPPNSLHLLRDSNDLPGEIGTESS